MFLIGHLVVGCMCKVAPGGTSACTLSCSMMMMACMHDYHDVQHLNTGALAVPGQWKLKLRFCHRCGSQEPLMVGAKLGSTTEACPRRSVSLLPKRMQTLCSLTSVLSRINGTVPRCIKRIWKPQSRCTHHELLGSIASSCSS